MAVLVVAIVVYLRGDKLADYARGGDEGGLADLAGDLTASPAVWILVFLGLLLVFGGGTLAYLGAFEFGDPALWGAVLVGVSGLVVVGYVFLGSYWSARSRGKPNSLAVGEGAALVALLAVAAVTVKLFLG